jgi:hypothetical protein
LTTGTTPYGTATGDFNGDGLPDMAVTNSGSTGASGVSVYINTGSGLPATATYSMTTGSGPRGVVAGDFNGDGKTDLAVANVNSASVSIFTNSGSSINVAKNVPDLTANTNPNQLVAGDFNGDGKTDLAVTNTGAAVANGAFVYINSGSALPTTRTETLTTGSSPWGIAIGDFTGDGKPDMAVANNASNTVFVYHNNGTATPFPTTIGVGDFTLTGLVTPAGITTGDFNSDGKLDLAVANNGSTSVSLFTNTGASLPTTASSILTAGTAPEYIVAGDFNGDGKTDLAVTNFTSNSTSTFINTGTGLSTIISSTLTTGSGPLGLVAADFNVDGRTDLAVANSSANTVSVFNNQSVVAAAAKQIINQDNTIVGAKINLAVGSTSDAFDIVSSTGTTLAAFDSAGREKLGTSAAANGSFTSKFDLSNTSGTKGITTGDFNGDGKTDLALTRDGSTTVAIYINTASGLPQTPSYNLTAGNNPQTVIAGDFNGDGLTDVAVANGGTNSTLIYLNTGSALPTTSTSTLVPGGGGLATGDFNGDGKTDLAISNGTNITVFNNTGSTTVPFSGSTTLTAGTTPTEVVAGDFNGDGKTDLAVTNNGSANISVYINTGTALPGSPTSTLAAATGVFWATTGDFNGDGKTDLAVTNWNAGAGSTASIYINTGAALPTTVSSTLTTGTGPFYPVAADFNGDGKTDLAVTNSGSTSVSVFINTGTALPNATVVTLTTDASPEGLAAGDFNGDGKTDLAATNGSGASTPVFFNNSLGPSRLTVATANSNESGLIIQGVNNQAANFFQVQSNTGALLASINNQGSLMVSNGTSVAGGSNDISLCVDTGCLPGFSGSNFPTIKSGSGALYFAVGGAYAGYVNSAGFNNISDVNKKENFQALNLDDVLSKINQLPVEQYNFKTDDPSVQHIGTFAQNFYAAFGLNGTDNTSINVSDEIGVTLAGIKALIGRTDALNSQIQNSNFGNLNVSGTATIDTLTVTGSAQFAGDITVGGHVITAGGQPTSQPQAAAGGLAAVSVGGTDTTGTITITTGSDPTAGDLAKILFSRTYGQAPHIVLSPSNNSAAGLRFYKGATSSTDFMFDALDNPQPNTTYTFDYFIAQ